MKDPNFNYRVWYIINNKKPVYNYVSSVEEGIRMIDALANCQLAIPEHIISSNEFGLEKWDDGIHEWNEWENEECYSINEIRKMGLDF